MKVVSLFLVSCVAAFAQPAGWIMSGFARAGGFSFETRLEPPLPRIEGLGAGGWWAEIPLRIDGWRTASITFTSVMTSRSSLFDRRILL